MCLQFLQSGAETGVLGQAGLCNKTRKQTTGKTLVNLVNPGVFIVMDTGFPKVHKFHDEHGEDMESVLSFHIYVGPKY